MQLWLQLRHVRGRALDWRAHKKLAEFVLKGPQEEVRYGRSAAGCGSYGGAGRYLERDKKAAGRRETMRAVID
jgi:hypothetical protein